MQESSNLLGPYRDMIHFAERVNLWWAVFLLDRRVALTTGLPPSIHQDEQMVCHYFLLPGDGILI